MIKDACTLDLYGHNKVPCIKSKNLENYNNLTNPPLQWGILNLPLSETDRSNKQTKLIEIQKTDK